MNPAQETEMSQCCICFEDEAVAESESAKIWFKCAHGQHIHVSCAREYVEKAYLSNKPRLCPLCKKRLNVSCFKELRDKAMKQSASTCRLRAAICRQDAKAVRKILKSTVDFDLRDDDGENFIHMVVKTGTQEILEMLLNSGALRLINEVNDNGESSLFFAIEKKNRCMIESLVAAGARIDLVNDSGESLFDWALHANDPEIIKLLLDSGLNQQVNQRDADGRTPLHQLVMNVGVFGKRFKKGPIKIAQLLLEHGAEIDLVDNDGDTPLDVADIYGRKKMAQFFREAKASSVKKRVSSPKHA